MTTICVMIMIISNYTKLRAWVDGIYEYITVQDSSFQILHHPYLVSGERQPNPKRLSQRTYCTSTVQVLEIYTSVCSGVKRGEKGGANYGNATCGRSKPSAKSHLLFICQAHTYVIIITINDTRLVNHCAFEFHHQVLNALAFRFKHFKAFHNLGASQSQYSQSSSKSMKGRAPTHNILEYSDRSTNTVPEIVSNTRIIKMSWYYWKGGEDNQMFKILEYENGSRDFPTLKW